MTPNKLPPLPSPKCLAKLSKDGEWAEIVPANDWTVEMWVHGTDDVYTRDQMHAYAAEALRQSQSLPAGAVSDAMVDAARSAHSVDRISNGEIMDKIAGHGFGDRLIRGLIESALKVSLEETIQASELRDSFRWNALLNRIDTASAKEFGTLLNIIGDARAMGCGCLENYVDQIDVGELR